MIPDLFDVPWFSWLIGALLVVLGLALCFRGRRFLKPLLGVLGAGIGAMGGVKVADLVAVNMRTLFNDLRIHYVVIVGVCSAGCVAVSVLVWKAALALLTGFLGYTMAAGLESIPVIAKIINDPSDPSNYLYYAFYSIAILLPMSLLFLPDRWLVPVISGAVGAAMATFGVDLFIEVGLIKLVLHSIMSRAVPDKQVITEPLLILSVAWVFTASAGVIYQFFDDSDDLKDLVKQHVYFEDI